MEINYEISDIIYRVINIYLLLGASDSLNAASEFIDSLNKVFSDLKIIQAKSIIYI